MTTPEMNALRDLQSWHGKLIELEETVGLFAELTAGINIDDCEEQHDIGYVRIVLQRRVLASAFMKIHEDIGDVRHSIMLAERALQAAKQA